MRGGRAGAVRLLLFVLATALLLVACTAEDGFGKDGAPEVTNPDFERTPPPLKLTEYVGTDQQAKDDGSRNALIDMTNTGDGYIMVQCNAAVAGRLRVVKNDGDAGQDDYILDTGGKMQAFPLARGNGSYTFILFLFVENTPQGPAYERFLEVSAQVSLSSEFAPFLVPSSIVEYDADSRCVALSYELTQHCATDLEVAQQIYDYIAHNISYDTQKAEQVVQNPEMAYVPSPDDTLRAQKGICYDYASLAAAMLRANGIPTKLIKGDAVRGNGDTVYHAWNMIWLEEAGWIAVKIPSNPKDWARIDLTFAASSGEGIAQYVGDGNNYIEMSVH